MPGSPTPQTVDQVIAANLRRLRENRGLSRRQLAELLTSLTGEKVADTRIIALEGARGPGRPLRSATWVELVQLCLALDVELYDLVLPPGGEVVQLPVVDLILDHPEREQVKVAVDRTADREELSALIFGMPVELVDSKEAREAFFTGRGRFDDLAEIQKRRTELIEQLTWFVEHGGSNALISLFEGVDEFGVPIDYDPERGITDGINTPSSE